ncbi:CLAVATA3/ESR (CLE)-related protein ESR2-like [Phragmites australis]|uniref:CLAVATA3/ESR (CLE)-related protein ESR2-like n=1 Tax=Phragmites australis TaxID=29695 RepID=UPI002D77449F|nr:CLAVATA3/ESR (CLE)-related protein ESR2-like [Phragmites australis]
MASRMVMVAMSAFLVCALLASTPEAARMQLERGEVVVAGVDGGHGTGNVHYWEQQREFIGRRPRLASSTRRDGVALATSRQVVSGDGGVKREVPGGSDPIHHGDMAPSSSTDP